jgi:AcrR family transcriptional regulator
MKGKKTTREKILDAASAVVLKESATGLTLEKASKVAGVSKGGLLYHFPTKQALLQGMIERVIDDFETSVFNRIANDPEEKGRFLRAYLLEAAAPPAAGSPHERRKRLQSALLAAIANDNRLLDPLRERYIAYQDLLVKDGLDPIDATITRLAADAMWLTALFDIETIPEKMSKEVLNYLLKISYGKDKDKEGS